MELETLNERYDLVIERIFQIVKEENVRSEYRAYFQTTAKFLIKVDETLRMAEDGFLDTESLEDARRRNRDFYQDILEENYGTSYANPAYAVSELGEKFGGILSFLYTDLRSCIGLAYEGRRDWIAIFLELFVEIYNAFETTGEVDKREIEQTIYWFYHDYSEIFVERNVQEIVDPSLDFFTKIVMEADLSDVRYLYRYGEYISDCEVEIAKFLGEMEEEKERKA